MSSSSSSHRVDQIQQAAAAVLHPLTDAATRQAATQFLQDWNTANNSNWRDYQEWLVRENFEPQSLAWTLLYARLGRVTPGEDAAPLQELSATLWQWMATANHQETSASSSSVAHTLARLLIRTSTGSSSWENHLRQMLMSSSRTSPPLAWKIAGALPEQVQEVHPAHLARQILQPILVSIIWPGVESHDVSKDSLQCLACWHGAVPVSLHQLPRSLLQGLVQVLSSSSQTEADSMWMAAKTLRTCIPVYDPNQTSNNNINNQEIAMALWNQMGQSNLVKAPLEALGREADVDDASNHARVALVGLVCDLVVEYDDVLLARPPPAAGMVEWMATQWTTHPQTSVVLEALELWLHIHQVDLQDRHETYQQNLYQQYVLPACLERSSMHHAVADYEDFDDNDMDDFEPRSDWMDLRRALPDFYVATYQLLRSNYLQICVQQGNLLLSSSSSHVDQKIRQESSWWALGQVSKDVIVRATDPACNFPDDQGQTVELLWRLLTEGVLSHSSSNGETTTLPDQLLRGGQLDFVAKYMPVWRFLTGVDGNNPSPKTSPSSFLSKILEFFIDQLSVVPLPAAEAIRSLCVSYLVPWKSLWESLQQQQESTTSSEARQMVQSIVQALQRSLETILTLPPKSTTYEAFYQATSNRPSLASSSSSSGLLQAKLEIAEGTTRVVTQIKQVSLLQSVLEQSVWNPILSQVHQLLQTVSSLSTAASPNHEEALSHLFRVVQTIVRFCDATTNLPGMAEWLLQSTNRLLLEQAAPIVSRQAPGVLPQVLAVSQQMLKSVAIAAPSQLVQPSFVQTVPFVVQALEHTHSPECLLYIASAVEIFGPPSTSDGSRPFDSSFQELWQHVTNHLMEFFTIQSQQKQQQQSNKDDNESPLDEHAELIQAYFDCALRFLMYCPIALLSPSASPPPLTHTLTLALEAWSAGGSGEQRSTRAIILFLTNLYGFSSVRLPPHSQAVLRQHESWLTSNILTPCVPRIVQKCFGTLAGGMQALFPPVSDCLLAMCTPLVGQREDLQQDAVQQARAVLDHRFGWLTEAAGQTCNRQVVSASQIRDYLTLWIVLLQAPPSKPKARIKAKNLLVDYGQFAKGEMTTDKLEEYAI